MDKNNNTFWDQHPCGNLSNDKYKNIEYRKKKEPFLKDLIYSLNFKNETNFLEIGCGQGLEAFYLIKILNSTNSKYYGIDVSSKSIIEADKLFKMANLEKYELHSMDANDLSRLFQDSYFDFIFSFGVLHHTEATFDIINNVVFKILKGNSSSMIFLYNKHSPKVFVALLLRRFSNLIDKLFKKENYIYNFLKNNLSNYLKDTMLYECFGVPILKAYTKKEIYNFIDQNKFNVEVRKYDNKKIFKNFLPYMHQIILTSKK